MPRVRFLTLVVLSWTLTAAGCGEPRTPPSPQPTPPGGVTITGRERFGWNQQAGSTAELATFDYAIYVDGARRVLEVESCGSTAGADGFECSAPLPPLTPGRHTLDLATFTTAGGATLESPRSTALQVTVVPVLPPAENRTSAAVTFRTPGGILLEASVVAEGLDDPTDLAIAPDGRVFVAERRGRVVLVGESGAREALQLDVRVDHVDGGLTSLALDRDFERTRRVFLAYTAGDSTAASVQIARYTERGGALGQGAVIVDEEDATPGTTAIARVGPDRKLYVALGSGADPHAAQTAGSPFGKIHRLEMDGRTPADSAGTPPVLSSGHRDPRALAWNPVTGVLWEVERDDTGDELNAIVRGSNFGWPLLRGRAAQSGMAGAALQLPLHTDVSAAVFAPAGMFGTTGTDLLVAGRTVQDILRVRFSADGRQPAGAEPLLNGRFGRIGGLAVTAGGIIYLTTANTAVWGSQRDQVIRLRRLASRD